ncbi:alpha/beta fold hydrolase [Nodularia spumigena]|uniref:4,5:9,10-diseco-3-hydroxy-5,9, 17-trioxoandrosta-1(10),2-diene-4-oate hydrolase n=1 Tax=Nodularia spumigena UHCC 0039 TaxID=1914872 RepID=A0A2S0Q8H8_NODSP|nr:alpha/beta fold hydrolase [Nodularia spumigena]AVZ30749.1 4,5:9,10-diseco-3-hydroxy-5,9,17-trioxoandrosta-1(10),2-diene-4-oate hydrolase [Nodularia spumigena UHCC 0039]MEA5556709.1 alpha/beta fold hydrolase [Nodularia spumigena CH309]
MLTDIPPDQYIKVGEINTRYWTLGNKGKTILLFHGAGDSIEFWLYNINVLAQHYRVYAVDMVGSGRSDKPSASYSLTYLAEFIKDFMDTLSIERASLAGNSMGGGVAIQFALMFPQQVDKLVLVGSFGLGREVRLALRLTILPLVLRFLRPNRRKLMSMLKVLFYNATLIPQEWIEIRYPIFSLPHRHKAITKLARTNLNLLGVRRSVFSAIVNQLATITTPALIIWGKQDRILPVSHAYIAAEGLPNNRLHIFDSCGHYPQIEYPQEFNYIVLGFLAD